MPSETQVCRAQLPPSGYPHWPATPPPPQGCGETQVPQLSCPPHPSPAGAQLTFCCPQVSAVHEGGVMHEVRSNSMNSRSFSWGVIAPAVHSFGKVFPFDWLFEASSTWKSLKTTRPQVPALPPAVKGVSNV